MSLIKWKEINSEKDLPTKEKEYLIKIKINEKEVEVKDLFRRGLFLFFTNFYPIVAWAEI